MRNARAAPVLERDFVAFGKSLGLIDKNGWLQAVAENFEEMPNNSDQPIASISRWREEDGIIYFSVTSDGATGKEWIKRLENKDFRVGNYAKSVLRSPNFKPTKGVKYEIAVLGGALFSDGDRITKKIRAEATRRNLTKPNAEVACLIREAFTDEEIESMGLFWITTMHGPIRDSDGDLSLLNANRHCFGRYLHADCGVPGALWARGGGFAFVSAP